MRMSAISCWCSLLAAAAGAGSAAARPIARTAADSLILISKPRSRTSQTSGTSLRGDHEVRASILREGGLVLPGIERELLAVAHRPQPIRRDAQRDEIRARGQCAAFAQS